MFHQEITNLFEELREIPGNIGTLMLERENDISSILLGRCGEDFSIEQMEMVWLIAGRHIDIMYRRNLKLKEGIGKSAQLIPTGVTGYRPPLGTGYDPEKPLILYINI